MTAPPPPPPPPPAIQISAPKCNAVKLVKIVRDDTSQQNIYNEIYDGNDKKKRIQTMSNQILNMRQMNCILGSCGTVMNNVISAIKENYANNYIRSIKGFFIYIVLVKYRLMRLTVNDINEIKILYKLPNDTIHNLGKIRDLNGLDPRIYNSCFDKNDQSDIVRVINLLMDNDTIDISNETIVKKIMKNMDITLDGITDYKYNIDDIKKKYMKYKTKYLNRLLKAV